MFLFTYLIPNIMTTYIYFTDNKQCVKTNTLFLLYRYIFFHSDTNHQTEVLHGSPQREVFNIGW